MGEERLKVLALISVHGREIQLEPEEIMKLYAKCYEKKCTDLDGTEWVTCINQI